MKAGSFVSITVKNYMQTSVCRMLLVMAGDVELNPGPKGRGSAGKKGGGQRQQGEHSKGENAFDKHSGGGQNRTYHNSEKYRGAASQQNQRGNEAQNVRSKPDHSFSHTNQNVSDTPVWSQNNKSASIVKNSSWATQALSSSTGASQESVPSSLKSESSKEDWDNLDGAQSTAYIPNKETRGEASNRRLPQGDAETTSDSWAEQVEQEEEITEHHPFEEKQSVESASIVSVSSSSQVKQLSNLEHLENELKIMKDDLNFNQSNCSFCCNELETLLEKVNDSKVKEDVLNKILQLMQKRKDFLVSYFESFRELEELVKANVYSCEGSRTVNSSTQTSTAVEEHGQNEVQNAQQSMHQSQSITFKDPFEGIVADKSEQHGGAAGQSEVVTVDKQEEMGINPKKPYDKDQKRGSWGSKEKGSYRQNEFAETKNEPQIEKLGSMTLIQCYGDLFSAPEEDSLAHCVGADLRMGKGIAVDFKERFGGLGQLYDQKRECGQVAILKDSSRFIYYLVTKDYSTGKPTMDSLASSLENMAGHCKADAVKRVAMPTIGCGLDGLDWDKVKKLIKTTFCDLDIEITVYHWRADTTEGERYPAPKREREVKYQYFDNKSILKSPRNAPVVLYLAQDWFMPNVKIFSDFEKDFGFSMVKDVKPKVKELGQVIDLSSKGKQFYFLVCQETRQGMPSYTALESCFKNLFSICKEKEIYRLAMPNNIFKANEDMAWHIFSSIFGKLNSFVVQIYFDNC